MALIVEDRVMETTITTGTGALALGGAVTGFRDFDSVCANNDTCYYSIWAVDVNGNPSGDWETGLGTFTDTDTLTRTAVHKSSNSNNAVNLGAGTKYVMLSATAAYLSLQAQALPLTFNFSTDGEARFYADVAMTISQQATSGTGTAAYEKSTSAAPSTFSSTTSPISLQAGAWLKVSATTVVDLYAVHLKRTA